MLATSSALPAIRRAAGAACWALLLGCRGPAPDVLATWAGGEARVEHFDTFVRGLPEERRQPAPGRAVEEWVHDALEQFALREALETRARTGRLEEDPQVALRARYLACVEIGKRFVAAECPAETVSEAELRAVFERNADARTRPWILVRHIFQRISPADSDDERRRVRGEMEEILAELRRGASFVEMARHHSDSETARDGGLIGRISRQAPMDPEFVRVAWALADGELSGLVELPSGLHVILREDSGVEQAKGFESVAEDLRRAVVTARREACGSRFLAKQAQQSPVRLPETGLPVQPPGDEPILWIGEEAFATRELDGLAPEGQTLASSPVSLQLLEQFTEAVLLTAVARRERPELDTAYVEREAALRRQLALDREWRRQREALVAALPEAELTRFFEEHRGEFRSEATFDLGLILVPSTAARTAPQARELAAQLVERARGGEDFATLARGHSEHPTGQAGGRLGPLPWGRASVLLGKAAAEAAATLAVGEVSDPVLVARRPAPVFGLVRLYGREEPRDRTFEEARPEVLAALVTRRVGSLDRELRAKLLAEIDFQVHEAGVESYLAAVRGGTDD